MWWQTNNLRRLAEFKINSYKWRKLGHWSVFSRIPLQYAHVGICLSTVPTRDSHSRPFWKIDYQDKSQLHSIAYPTPNELATWHMIQVPQLMFILFIGSHGLYFITNPKTQRKPYTDLHSWRKTTTTIFQSFGTGRVAISKTTRARCGATGSN